MKNFLTVTFFIGVVIEWIGVAAFFVGHFLVPEWRSLYQLIPIGGFPALAASLLQSQMFPGDPK